jgi:hypothetical protein
VLTLEVSLSFIQSWFLLELKPLWARGVLRYGYKDPSFSQVLPVISSSVNLHISAAPPYAFATTLGE